MTFRLFNWRAVLFLFGLSMASLSFANGPASTSGSAQRYPLHLEGEIKHLRSQLEARGYEVLRGSFKLFTIADCKYPLAVIKNCMGNNPAAPYILPVLPRWPDETIDASLNGLLGPLPDSQVSPFRLDRREAVLIVGLLPPPARYFGLQTYVFTRMATVDPRDPIFQQTLADPVMHGILFSQAPDPSRITTFASIGNSINNVVIERQSGGAFNRQRSFVISTDAGMGREMTEALVDAGISTRSQVFGEPVSPQVARIGLGAKADDFMPVIRYAQPDDPAAGERWRQQIPLAVLRVRDRHAAATEPWPKPAYDPKGGHPEHWLQPDLARLVTAVKQQWKQPGATLGNFQSLQTSLDLVGQHCLLRPMNCLGDTQDADYQVSPSLTIDDGTVVAVAGTLGTATRNATYVGLSVNWLKALVGVVNVSDVDLQGTAARYASTVGNTNKLYVEYFARDCSGIEHCQQITEAMVPKGDVVKIIQRNYVVPGTARGVDPARVLNPVAIVLKRPSPVAGARP